MLLAMRRASSIVSTLRGPWARERLANHLVIRLLVEEKLRDKSPPRGYFDTTPEKSEARRQAMLAAGEDITNAVFVSWRSAEEQETAEQLNPTYYWERDPTPPLPYPDDIGEDPTVPYEETCRPEKPTRLDYKRDGSVV